MNNINISIQNKVCPTANSNGHSNKSTKHFHNPFIFPRNSYTVRTRCYTMFTKLLDTNPTAFRCYFFQRHPIERKMKPNREFKSKVVSFCSLKRHNIHPTPSSNRFERVEASTGAPPPWWLIDGAPTCPDPSCLLLLLSTSNDRRTRIQS